MKKSNLIFKDLIYFSLLLIGTLILTQITSKSLSFWSFWLKGFPIYIGGFIGYLFSEHLPKGALKIFLVVCVIILAAAFSILLYLH